MKRWAITLTAVGLVGGISLPVHAQEVRRGPTECGITGSATAPATITYDPFSPNGLSEVTVPLILRRPNRGSYRETPTSPLIPTGTFEVSLILVRSADTPPIDVTHNGSSVIYSEGATAGHLQTLADSGASGEIYYRWRTLGFGSNEDISSPLDLRITVPPGVDLTATEPISLDILYICRGQLVDSVTVPRREIGAIKIDVNTVSALQVYYAGSPLDFGSIGDVTTDTVLASPERYTTSAANSLRVRSSGVFTVRLRSQNNFLLTYPGGDLSDPAQTIRYSVRFLDREVDSDSVFRGRACGRAGVDGRAGILPLRATLQEGGAGKTPSSNYRDVISITFAPIVTTADLGSCDDL